MAEYVTEWGESVADFTVREEVVRCRDCKHCMSYWKSDYCDYFSHVINDPDGFCAWASRKESE